MKLRNSNLPSAEGKEQKTNDRRRFTARVDRDTETAEMNDFAFAVERTANGNRSAERKKI